MQGQKHHNGSHFIIRQGQEGNSERKNNHYRGSCTGRVSPALKDNHDVSVCKGALYIPDIRRHSTSSHQLRGQRRPPGVPCAAVTPLQCLFPGLQWHLLVTASQVTGLKCLTRVSHAPCTTLFLLFLLVDNFFCCCFVALEMLQPQKLQLPVTRGDVKAQKVKVSPQPICDQPVSYQQHKSVPLDAWHSWAFGKPTTPIISSPWPGTFGPPLVFWTSTSLSVWFLQSSGRPAWVSDSMWFSHRWRGKSWTRWDLCTVYQDKKEVCL